MDVAQAYPSRGWIKEVKKHTTDENLTLISKGFRIPTLLLQAGKDSYVDIARQNFVKSKLGTQIPGANDCLQIWSFADDRHSIWRGLAHEAVFREMLKHYLHTKTC
jgi:alpha-beta hydrolase superfamily lysophospholipase